MLAPPAEPVNRYPFKISPYGSHSLLLAEFPARGEGRRVLDVGCGYGHLGEILAERGFRVTGVDVAGIAHSPDIAFLPADLDRGLPATQEPFDFILCADVLEHLRDPQQMLRDCRQRLARGGTLIASLPNSGNAYFRFQVMLGRFPQHDRGLFDRTHLRFYTWHGWLELLAGAGLQVQTLVCSGVPVQEAFPGLPLVGLFEWLSFVSAKLWKKMFAYQFIVRAGV
jgi:SAM-dependent methyltransferase